MRHKSQAKSTAGEMQFLSTFVQILAYPPSNVLDSCETTLAVGYNRKPYPPACANLPPLVPRRHPPAACCRWCCCVAQATCRHRMTPRTCPPLWLLPRLPSRRVGCTSWSHVVEALMPLCAKCRHASSRASAVAGVPQPWHHAATVR